MKGVALAVAMAVMWVAGIVAVCDLVDNGHTGFGLAVLLMTGLISFLMSRLLWDERN